MNILLISYGNLNYDGRLREIVNIANKVGHTVVFTVGKPEDKFSLIDSDYVYRENSYFGFIKFCMKKSKELRNIDIIFVDNRRAVIPAILLRKRLNPKCIVQDVRELYLTNEVKHFVGKVGCWVEQYLIKRADLLLCANKYRAQIMKEHYKLEIAPTVYENYRMLSFSDDYSEDKYDQKYRDLLNKDTVKLISTSGCSVFRTNDRLVAELSKCQSNTELFLVGSNSESDEKTIKSIVSEKQLDNVHILGCLREDELKFLISKCDIGIVNYGKQDQNNIYCASGKIFEFLFEGKPVVTTTNPPLKELCDKYQIGVSDDSYAVAIDTVVGDYSYYREKVQRFISSIDIDQNNQMVAEKIKEVYTSKTCK